MDTRACLLLAAMVLGAGACAKQDVIPEQLQGQVDRDLRFVDVKDDPAGYHGKLVLTGGKVLSAERVEAGTRIEVLQMPLSSDLYPKNEERSNGRFIALDTEKQVIDPAVLDDHQLITIVGEVVGQTEIHIDQVKEQVPKFRVKHVTIWDRDRIRPYYGYGAPYAWGYGRYYGFPYYW